MAKRRSASVPYVQPYRYPSPNIPLPAIRRFARQIAKRFHPEKIILFGSYATANRTRRAMPPYREYTILNNNPRCGGGSPDPATVRDRRSPLLHSFGDLRSEAVARSGDRPTTWRALRR